MAVVLWQPRNNFIKQLAGNEDTVTDRSRNRATDAIEAADVPIPPDEADRIPIEDDSNNNEPISDLNQVDHMLRIQQPPDVAMDEDL